ncbi:hypothetical protein QV13_12750 [Mesorhizobium hungaricum]|jgi:predicted hotdog family 3-hydroxylacyl-ACP dehydratase|uniref:Uncharacterized protein n=1 Tax=Mesorhizobium hungaricum TaxID=1566387 RepID=A0A1C2DS90_9HYPH|nr:MULTISPECIES: hypothetical protein [Mesorhizobium]MBN9236012.1 hypothetical protein [Mesorhizobium sp.]OCX17619.1 hypothetical protein QV13_12750 [Mesorhizobium hungaricum]
MGIENADYLPTLGQMRQVARVVEWSDNPIMFLEVFDGEKWIDAHSPAFLAISKKMILGTPETTR